MSPGILRSTRTQLSPFPRKIFYLIFAFFQFAKLGIILSQPDSAQFLGWFYAWSHVAPYSPVPGFFAVPYSLLWYALNSPSFFGYWVYNFYLLAIDTVFTFWLSRRFSQIYVGIFQQFSFFCLLASPQDYFVLVFITLGRMRLGSFFVAAALKLPLIPPILTAALWHYIFFTPGWSASDPLNWARYVFLGMMYALNFGIWTLRYRPEWILRINRKLLLLQPLAKEI